MFRKLSVIFSCVFLLLFVTSCFVSVGGALSKFSGANVSRNYIAYHYKTGVSSFGAPESAPKNLTPSDVAVKSVLKSTSNVNQVGGRTYALNVMNNGVKNDKNVSNFIPIKSISSSELQASTSQLYGATHGAPLTHHIGLHGPGASSHHNNHHEAHNLHSAHNELAKKEGHIDKHDAAHNVHADKATHHAAGHNRGHLLRAAEKNKQEMLRHTWNRGNGLVKKWNWDKGTHIENNRAHKGQKLSEHHNKAHHQEGKHLKHIDHGHKKHLSEGHRMGHSKKGELSKHNRIHHSKSASKQPGYHGHFGHRRHGWHGYEHHSGHLRA